MLEREKISFLGKGHFLSVASFLLLFCLFAFLSVLALIGLMFYDPFSPFLLLLSLFYICF